MRLRAGSRREIERVETPMPSRTARAFPSAVTHQRRPACAVSSCCIDPTQKRPCPSAPSVVGAGSPGRSPSSTASTSSDARPRAGSKRTMRSCCVAMSPPDRHSASEPVKRSSCHVSNADARPAAAGRYAWTRWPTMSTKKSRCSRSDQSGPSPSARRAGRRTSVRMRTRTRATTDVVYAGADDEDRLLEVLVARVVDRRRVVLPVRVPVHVLDVGDDHVGELVAPRDVALVLVLENERGRVHGQVVVRELDEQLAAPDGDRVAREVELGIAVDAEEVSELAGAVPRRSGCRDRPPRAGCARRRLRPVQRRLRPRPGRCPAGRCPWRPRWSAP